MNDLPALSGGLAYRERIFNRAATAGRTTREHCAAIAAEADAEILQLRSALEQAEKDARRYRWLRKLPSLSFDAGDCEWTGGYWPDALDAAIDAPP